MSTLRPRPTLQRGDGVHPLPGRPPPGAARYDFDEWYDEHYGKARAREQSRKRRVAKEKERIRREGGGGGSDGMLVLGGAMLAALSIFGFMGRK